MPRSFACHAASLSVPSDFHTCGKPTRIHSCTWHTASLSVPSYIHTCVVPHAYVWYAVWLWAPLYIHICDMSTLIAIHMRAMLYFYQFLHTFTCVTCHIHTRSMLYPSECLCTFIDMTCPLIFIHVRAMMHHCKCCHAFIHVTHRNTLQHTATHCNTLQHIATPSCIHTCATPHACARFLHRYLSTHIQSYAWHATSWCISLSVPSHFNTCDTPHSCAWRERDAPLIHKCERAHARHTHWSKSFHPITFK